MSPDAEAIVDAIEIPVIIVGIGLAIKLFVDWLGAAIRDLKERK